MTRMQPGEPRTRLLPPVALATAAAQPQGNLLGRLPARHRLQGSSRRLQHPQATAWASLKGPCRPNQGPARSLNKPLSSARLHSTQMRKLALLGL